MFYLLVDNYDSLKKFDMLGGIYFEIISVNFCFCSSFGFGIL